MKREAYAAARTISPKLHAYFARHRAEAVRQGQKCLAPLPDAETIEALIDAAFWASLRREEGYAPTISLAFVSPDQVPSPLLFERPLPVEPAALTRVAPAVERPAFTWASGATAENCLSGAPRARFPSSASSSRCLRPACWWSSITGAMNRASTSTWLCSKAI